MNQTAVVVPNWNGIDTLGKCLDSLLSNTENIIVVENGSSDGSLELLKEKYPKVELVINKTNLGFAGGVNSGIKKAMELGYSYVAMFNNDAVAGKEWLYHLVQELDGHSEVGIATCKLLSEDHISIDSTGDIYSNWGLPYPRGRDEQVSDKYDQSRDIFGASGGASIYRVAMLKDIGLFDEDFFAYYEDVDLSFRAQLAGWKVSYVPKSVAYHQIGATSGKIKGFTTYQSMKNLPLLFIKNVPRKYFLSVGKRLFLAQTLFLARAMLSGRGIYAFKGLARGMIFIPKKLSERIQIQSAKKVTDEYIWSIITHDLPPNAKALRELRNKWWRLTGKSHG